MTERKILGALLTSRDSYYIIIDRLDPADFTEQFWMVLQKVGDFYKADPEATKVDVDLLVEAVTRDIPNTKHHQVFEKIIRESAALEQSAPNVVRLYIDQKKEVVGSKLASALTSGGALREVPKLLAEYQDWSDRDELDDDTGDTDINGVDLSSLIKESFDPASLIKVSPKALNDRLDGGVLRGHHIVVFARPEMGKTLLVCNMAAGFLQQGLRVLYIGNEEPIEDTYLRMVCRLSGVGRHDVIQSPDEAGERAKQRGLDNLYMASMSPGTLQQIEAKVREVEADVIIVDQLRNVKIRNDNFTQALEAAAKGIRQIGKRCNCVTVSVTQAGDSAEGRAVLDMGDVDSSNTGIPAQADVLVGLGASTQDLDMGRRIISLPKNKRGGNHDNFPVQVNLQTSQIRSIV